MYYGTMKNQKARKSITTAFFKLLEKKHFSDISVTDIVKEAGIARVTYYRNFYYKEEIIENYVGILHESLLNSDKALQQKKKIDIFSQVYFELALEHAFTLFQKNRKNFLLLNQNGFSSTLQSLFNEYTEKMFVQYSSASKYQILLISGAICNITIEWLKSENPETPQTLAKEIVELLRVDIFKGH